MAWLLYSLCVLLPAAALFMETEFRSKSSAEIVISHEEEPDPSRQNYIWNPFPASCGENATMVRCAGVCPETCAFKSLKCETFCGVNCACKPGYVFDEKLELCILRAECPQGIKQSVVETHRVFQ